MPSKAVSGKLEQTGKNKGNQKTKLPEFKSCVRKVETDKKKTEATKDQADCLQKLCPERDEWLALPKRHARSPVELCRLAACGAEFPSRGLQSQRREGRPHKVRESIVILHFGALSVRSGGALSSSFGVRVSERQKHQKKKAYEAAGRKGCEPPFPSNVCLGVALPSYRSEKQH